MNIKSVGKSRMRAVNFNLLIILAFIGLRNGLHSAARETAGAGASPAAHLGYEPERRPDDWSVAAAETIMARYPDYRKAYWKSWTYVQGYVLWAFDQLYRKTGDRRYLDYIKRYVDEFVDGSGRFNGSKLDSLDDIMPGSAIVNLYEHTGDPRYKKAAEQFRHAFDQYPRSDGQFWHNRRLNQMWIDGVFMGQMFLVRYGQAIGDRDACMEEVARQITTFARHCEKGVSGLYYHAWAGDPAHCGWADPKTGCSPEVWSEGLGWYALVLVESLAVLPPEHPKRAEVLDIFRCLAAGLKRTQDAGGGWYMIVDKGGQADNWIDPSGTAMFVYALKRGVNLGLLDRATYGPVAERGFHASLQFAEIDKAGLVDVRGGGDGIGVKGNYAQYVHFPRRMNAKETVGGFLWASGIMGMGGKP